MHLCNYLKRGVNHCFGSFMFLSVFQLELLGLLPFAFVQAKSHSCCLKWITQNIHRQYFIYIRLKKIQEFKCFKMFWFLFYLLWFAYCILQINKYPVYKVLYIFFIKPDWNDKVQLELLKSFHKTFKHTFILFYESIKTL